jgi:hypothetical protein
VLKLRFPPGLRLLRARAAVLLGIVVLVCVPGLTRIGQKLETASHAPSFAKNIDCPPKKITIAPVQSASSPALPRTFDVAAIARAVPPPDAALPPPSPVRALQPLRAPPSFVRA